MVALGRVVHFDDRSRNFSVRRTLGSAAMDLTPRKRVWTAISTPLDQGREGACVGFGWAHELGSTPQRHRVDNSFAFDLYGMARAEDRAMGNHWSEGASVLAGARAAKYLKLIKSYSWAFSVNDILQTLMRKGPVVIGVNWYESMYDTNNDGLVRISGPLVGGHCIMLYGYWPRHSQFGDCVLWQNSWGPSYGINGRGFLRVSDLQRLMNERGEACIPTDSSILRK